MPIPHPLMPDDQSITNLFILLLKGKYYVTKTDNRTICFDRQVM